MRIPRVFVNAALQENSELSLEPGQSHYISRVLRLKPGASLILFNGDGYQYPASIISDNRKSLQIHLEQKNKKEPAPSIHIHLALGLSKGDRFDTAIQKATELGVSEITPLLTEFNAVKLPQERMQKKQAHWQSIIQSACEQSERCYLPQLNPITTLSEWTAFSSYPQKLILHPGSEQSFRDLKASAKLLMLIGPEGGLSDSEIDWARSNGFIAVKFGQHILRTETAAMAAITAAQTLWAW